MIIPNSFSNSYDAFKGRWDSVKQETDGIFKNQIITAFPGATFNSRIKSMESVYLKAQKENYKFPLKEIDDFLACEVIVLNLADIYKVKQRVIPFFEYEEGENQGSDDPKSFAYNDTRLYLKLKDSPLRPDKSVLEMKFELQIKTFLQFAWQKAGHDVIYKPKIISYGYERVFYQVKALLELADNILSQIDQAAKILTDNGESSKDDTYQVNIKKIIDLMERYFDHLQFSNDHRRTANIVNKYLTVANKDVNELDLILQDAKSNFNPIFDHLTISPADKVFILLFEKYKGDMLGRLAAGRNKVLITSEMEDLYPVLKNIHENGRINIDL